MSPPSHDTAAPTTDRADPAVEVERAIHAAYRERTPKSLEWYGRASASLVSGVSGAVRYFAPYPSYFASGDGSRVTDIDGNDFIDCFLCGATLLLGHRPPEVVAGLHTAVDAGSLVLNPMLSTEVAESLQSMVPSAQRVRLVNSGTEAVMNALRFARAFTGRSKVVKFLGTYHGMDDQVLVGLSPRGNRLGSGIPESAVADIVNADLRDLAAIAEILSTGEIAALLIDPSMHHCGLWAASAEHYATLLDMAHAAGALVIFDEVISGFRLAPGGGQEYFGVVPDLSVFGKALAVGEKLGAIVGRADVMAVADTTSERTGPFAFQSGTCSDSAVAQTASLLAMQAYRRLGDEGAYELLDHRAARLARGIEAAFEAAGIGCRANQLGPIVRLFLTDGDSREQDHVTARSPRAINAFHLALLTEGVLTLPGSNDFFLSFAHTDDDIDQVIDAAHRVLATYDIGAVAGR